MSVSPAASVLNAVRASGIKKQAKMSKPELHHYLPALYHMVFKDRQVNDDSSRSKEHNLLGKCFFLSATEKILKSLYSTAIHSHATYSTTTMQICCGLSITSLRLREDATMARMLAYFWGCNRTLHHSSITNAAFSACDSSVSMGLAIYALVQFCQRT